jgi:hypothetical protein
MKYIILCLAVLFVHSGYGQTDDGMKKIESARIAFITQRLDLTPEQAEKFWPLYREYAEKRQQLRNEYLNARQTTDKQLTDEESKKLLEKGLQLKQQQLELEKNYTERLNVVITNRQLLQLRKAEEDFRQLLLERIDRRNQQRERLQRREDRRNNEN